MRLSQFAKKLTAGALACLLAVTMTGLLSACGSGDPLATTQEAQQEAAGQDAASQDTQPKAEKKAESGSKKDAASEKQESEQPKAEKSAKAESSKSSKASSGSSKSSSDSKGKTQSTPKKESSSKPKNDTITVKVSIDCSRAHSYNSKWPSSMGSKTVTLKKGATVRDALGKMGVSVRGTSYVTSINGLAEFSCGQTSGWKYSVDGTFPGKACNVYKLNGGEVVRWVYVLDVSDYE